MSKLSQNQTTHTRTFCSDTEASDFIRALDRSGESDFQRIRIHPNASMTVEFICRTTQADINRRMTAVKAIQQKN